MKRIVALVCFLVVATACTTQPAGNSNTANTSTADTTEKKTAAMPSEADIIAKEKAAWDAVRTKDADAFGKLMTDDYIEVVSLGVMDKAASIASIKDIGLTDVTFSDWKMTPIDKDAVILTYNATVKGTFKGEAVPPGPYHEVAAYVNRNGEWLAIYYQETMASTEPMPAMSPAPKKAAGSPPPPPPPAKSAETGPDPIANEKIVWDYFKTRNFDGFGAVLAPEFMEVEPTGVYDKAGSIKSLQEMDASQFEEGNWKALKFDSDAALVTYTVTTKGAKPQKEYHSTIWVNRDGRWLGLFHQGTPEMKPQGPNMKPKATPEMKPKK